VSSFVIRPLPAANVLVPSESALLLYRSSLKSTSHFGAQGYSTMVAAGLLSNGRWLEEHLGTLDALSSSRYQSQVRCKKFKPANVVVPSESTLLQYRSFVNSMSPFMMPWEMVKMAGRSHRVPDAIGAGTDDVTVWALRRYLHLGIEVTCDEAKFFTRHPSRSRVPRWR
jgi:hypothetical protein